MTGNEYQALAARTIAAKNKITMELHSLYGMCAEVGELHGIYQKVYQGHELDKEHLKKETGDILWMIAEFCTSQGWKMEDIMQMNIDKLKARFPEGFTAERSLHRAEGDI